MGRIPLQNPKSAELLPKWREQPGMLGVRVTFNTPQTAAWLKDGTADWFWPEAEKAGLPVMFLAFGLVNLFEPIAQRHPGLPLVIDHMGVNTAIAQKGQTAEVDRPRRRAREISERQRQAVESAQFIAGAVSLQGPDTRT